MCQSKAEGGKRCEYAEKVAVARRRAKRKVAKEHSDGSSRFHERVEKEVNKWKDANRELVTAHMPERMPFQVKPSRRPVPQHLLDMLSSSSKDPITGRNKEDRLALCKELYDKHEAWEESLDREHLRAVDGYTMHTFGATNTFLRRKGFPAFKRENRYFASEGKSAEERAKELVSRIDEAIDQAPKNESPRKLYRFFRVPAGITATEYVKRYFHEGEAFKDPAFMSTSVDPEFVMAHIDDRNNGGRNSGYVVMEIVSDRGVPLQGSVRPTPGWIQSLEQEVLMPRNSKFRIIATRRSQSFKFAADRDDLNEQYHRRSWKKHYREGDGMRFPVVQLVDEALIADHWRQERGRS